MATHQTTDIFKKSILSIANDDRFLSMNKQLMGGNGAEQIDRQLKKERSQGSIGDENDSTGRSSAVLSRLRALNPLSPRKLPTPKNIESPITLREKMQKAGYEINKYGSDSTRNFQLY